MYFTDVIKVLLRRWYVVLLGLLLVFGGLVYAVRTVPTQYQATGEVLILLPPKATGPNTPTNPYMNLSPGLVTTATLIAAQLNNNVNHAKVLKAGFDSEYALGVAPDTGPLLVITAKDVNPAAATKTMEEVLGLVGEQLDRMQADLGIPENQYMYTRRNDTAHPAEALPGSKIRAGGVIGGGGMVMTVVAAFLLDGLLRRRKLRHVEGSESAETVPQIDATRSRRRGRDPGDAEPEQPRAPRTRPRAVPEPASQAKTTTTANSASRRAAGAKRR
jgi:hypothetical protein